MPTHETIKPLPPWGNRADGRTYRQLAAASGRSLTHVYLCWRGQRKPGKDLAALMQKLGWKGEA